MMRLVLLALLLLTGCTPLLSRDVFVARIVRDHPSGSAEGDLRQGLTRRGFVEGRPFGPPLDLPKCWRRQVSYWLVAGGDRYVCYAAADGVLTDVRADEFVMSP